MSERNKGFAGKQLRVFLDRREFAVQELRWDIVDDFIGGVGYAAKLLYEELPPGIDPLDPANILTVSTGPLTMRKIPGGGSVELCFKSPLTGGWGEARAGSDFGPDLRCAGFDHLIIQGRADEPVYLVVEEGKVELRSAAHLKGKTVSEKRRRILQELPGDRYSVLCIGPGGENLVRFATVMFEDRAAGRVGGGAVLGSKNLLAIAVRGKGQVAASRPDRLQEALRSASQTLRESPVSVGFRENGTIGDLPANDHRGDWPTKNWQSNSWGKAAELFDYYQKHNFIKPYPCYRGCYIACGRKVHVADGPYRTREHGGAEYESISCFTAYVLNEDMDAAVHSTFLCNEYGIDTISTGSAIAFAMECRERGLFGETELGGLDLRWGNGAVLPVLVRMIALREGIGDLLAEGVRRIAFRLGRGAERFAVHVKGLEGPAHDPRSGKALAVSYGTANRGMCHIHPVEAMAWDSGKMDWGLKPYGLKDPETVDRWDEEGKGREVKLLQDGLSLPDILGTCKFFMYAGITIDHLAQMLSALTGREIDGQALLRVSERVCNLQRLFNLREGFTAADDVLPMRVREVPSFGKYQTEARCGIYRYEKMIGEYYQARGWDADGVPTKAKLRELGL
jgi:aldehyde:ferredoxin oxidoreductase